MTVIGGVDGCKAGWIRLECEADGRDVSARLFVDAASLFGDIERFAVVTIDIPIGLPESGARECDVAARRLIQPRGSSVFPAPVRAVLAARSYPDACELSLKACGKSLSKQAFAILPKIREVDAVLCQANEDVRRRVREVHPEVCFRVWNGAPMMEPKKAGLGFTTRLVLVESRFGGQFARVRRQVARGDASDDDILDAFAALWTAERVSQGTASRLPGAVPPHDAKGLPMEMWA